MIPGPVRMDELGLDVFSKPAPYSPGQEKEISASDIEIGEGDLSLTDEDKKGLEEVYKGLEINEKVGDYKGGKPGLDTAKPLTSDNPILQKQNLAQQVKDISEEIEKTKSELDEEYGKVNINLSDGTYEEIEEKEDA